MPHVIMASMPRTLRTIAVLVLVALIPLRAVAAVTIGLCAAGHHEVSVPAETGHGHDAHAHGHHGGDEPPAKPAAPSCSTCVEHCSNAAFAPSFGQPVVLERVAQHLAFLAERGAPAFILDQLDRPPLA